MAQKRKPSRNYESPNRDDPIATDPDAWRRTVRLKVKFVPGMAADIKTIGLAWGCSTEAVIWCVMATWINETGRDREVLGLPYLVDSHNLLVRAHRRDLKAAQDGAEIETPETPADQIEREEDETG